MSKSAVIAESKIQDLMGEIARLALHSKQREPFSRMELITDISNIAECLRAINEIMQEQLFPRRGKE